jgi:hypothetical protein
MQHQFQLIQPQPPPPEEFLETPEQQQTPVLTEFPSDVLPPEEFYPSREALIEAANAWAVARGYVFIIERSTKERNNGRTTITMACDRCKSPADPDRERIRRSAPSQRTGCKFSILAKQLSSMTTWSLRHRAAEYSVHNHAPSATTKNSRPTRGRPRGSIASAGTRASTIRPVKPPRTPYQIQPVDNRIQGRLALVTGARFVLT